MNKAYNDYPEEGGYDDFGGGQDQILKKYLQGFRDRLFIFIPIMLLVGAGVAVFLMKEQPLYRSFTTIEVLRQEERRTGFEKVTDETIRSSDDLNTHLKVFESMRTVRAVAERVRSSMMEEFVAPYKKIDQEDSDVSIAGLLAMNRTIRPVRNTYIVSIEYVHPRPDVAKRVADLFAEEIANSYASVRSDGVSRAVQDLREQGELQRRKVENLRDDLESFNAKHGTISFGHQLAIEQETLGEMKQYINEKTEAIDRLRMRLDMVQTARSNGTPVTELGFIRSHPEISQVLMTLSARRLAIGDLGSVYQTAPPRLAQAQESLKAAEAELEIAVQVVVDTLANDLELAQTSLQKTQDRMAAKRDELVQLQGLKGEYEALETELDVNSKLYQYFYNRIQETQAQYRDDIRKVRILDPATAPGNPFQPLIKDAVTKGLGGGFFAAAFVVGLLVFFDDRVKTANDVESKVGLPILGMLSALPGKHKEVRDLIYATEKSPQNSESLNSIVASLRLDPQSRDAKVLMINSTISNEGKSYVSAALCHTFSRFEERVVLVNCDLRAKEDRLLRISGEGLIPYLDDPEKKIKDVVYKSQAIGCDVIPAGGMSKQPYALFGTPRFKQLIETLSLSYDRVILDTPPTNLFGDALTLVPFCKGAIYVCGFGRARVETAKQMVEKLRSTGCPVWGAVVNGVKSTQAKTYYPDHYQDKGSYKYYGKKTVRRI